MKDIALGGMAVVATGRLSFECVAASNACRAREAYTKQALDKRLEASASGLWLAVFGHCAASPEKAAARGLVAPFRRVLLYDSTTLALHPRHVTQFPGSTNQFQAHSQLIVQRVCNLLQGQLDKVALSGFTRNGQRVAHPTSWRCSAPAT